MAKQRFTRVPLSEVPVENDLIKAPVSEPPTVEKSPLPVPPVRSTANYQRGGGVSILLLGKDELLLDTRARILWGCGHSIEVTRYTAEAMQKLAQSSFDFVVICHTITINDREAVISSLDAAQRKTRVVCLYRGTHDGVRKVQWVDISDPENLVEAITSSPNLPSIAESRVNYFNGSAAVRRSEPDA